MTLKTRSKEVKNTQNEKIDKWFYSHDFDNGLKLIEFSYVGNHLVNAFCSTLAEEAKIAVCCGDYADPDKKRQKRNLYDLATNKTKANPVNFTDACKKTYQYIINEDTKQFVDVNKAKRDKWGYRIHPLPLLIAEGNGRGGGDYPDGYPDIDKVGIWARNLIRVSDEKPTKGYKELKVNFKLR
jgi:hypothetical protein